jgi:hypothetical protein
MRFLLGCALLAVGLTLAMPAVAEPAVADEERPPNLAPAVEPGPASHIHSAAYDVILVPRPAGATRSRMFNGERWVTLPNNSMRAYSRQYPRMSRNDAPRSVDRPLRRNSEWGEGRPRGQYRDRYDEPYRDRASGYWPRAYAGDDRANRYRSSGLRYRANEWRE